MLSIHNTELYANIYFYYFPQISHHQSKWSLKRAQSSHIPVEYHAIHYVDNMTLTDLVNEN